jgi:signal transduction histidine kinase
MCESYMHATMENLRSLTAQLERANEELAESSRAKDEFLAQTSHELRTPLNSILGFTKLILDGLCKNRDEERELLRDIFASGQHLLGIVNDILDIGRIEAGRMQLKMDTVNLRQVLDSTFPLVAVQMAGKSLALRDETQERDLPPVIADEVRLRQVFLNVLGNAIKFTEKGSITVRAKPAKARFLRLEVEDTGIGIPADRRDELFQRFVQLDTARARRHGGSGLGLAITRRLVEMMGGEIGLEDSPGGGTRVWFTLPVAGKEPYPRTFRERTTA